DAPNIAEEEPETEYLGVAEAPQIEFDDSGFERISDGDDDDTGELFKDAYVQEAIIDKVRAIEFDIEESTEAEVGSLLGSVEADGGFERIADEDEVEVVEEPTKGKKKPARSRSNKAAVTEE